MRQHLLGIVGIAAAACLTVPAALAADQDSQASARGRLAAARQSLERMMEVPGMARLLGRARGLFIGSRRGGAGGEGRGGVVLVRRNGAWSDPAFFTLSGEQGAQRAGPRAVALLLMSPRAVQAFEIHAGSWSLNGRAGLKVAPWSPDSENSRHDVVVWSDGRRTAGAPAGATLRLRPDRDLDDAWYHETTDSRRILTGQVHDDHANPLRETLSIRVAAR